MDDLAYWLALNKAPGIGSQTINQIIEQLQSPKLLFETPESLATLNISPSRKTAITNYLKTPHWHEVEQDLKWSEQNQNTILCLEDTRYPQLLKSIDAPPPILYVKGQIDVLNDIQLAMVGSRNPSPDGKESAWQFAKYLAQQGMVITSGLALGIDAQSHIGALAATQGKSIAVAGTGLDRVYPAKHKDLAHQLTENGALISEYALGSGPMKHHFPQRNRIISGLSVGTLVVEAALKSGSLITARYALEQAREVFAIPGSIHNPLSRGCHQLIKSGAKLVETAEDIIEELSSLILAAKLAPDGMTAQSITSPQPRQIDPLLPKIQQQILQHIGFSPISIDTLIERSGIDIAEINANLTLLEVNDYIQTLPGGFISIKHN